ncbi:MAG: hypothetical protein WCI77_00345 [Candidatus Omnitrophota bacterium]
MRFLWAFIFLLFIPQSLFGFPSHFVEIDLTKQRIVFDEFRFGNYNINGALLFDTKREDNSLIFHLEGKNLLFDCVSPSEGGWLKKRDFSWLKLRLVKRDNILFIHYVNSPEFLIKGKINLDSEEVSLDVDGNWQEDSLLMEGRVKAQARVWGTMSDILVNGSFEVINGRYQNLTFSRFSANFLGKPPILNLTDSQIYLPDGSIFRIEGVMDLNDFTNLFPKAEYISRKVMLGGWQPQGESDKNAGVKKNVDNNIDVVFDTYQRDAFMNSGTEVRYKMKQNQFLRLRMQDDKTIVGFERRKEF